MAKRKEQDFDLLFLYDWGENPLARQHLLATFTFL